MCTCLGCRIVDCDCPGPTCSDTLFCRCGCHAPDIQRSTHFGSNVGKFRSPDTSGRGFAGHGVEDQPSENPLTVRGSLARTEALWRVDELCTKNANTYRIATLAYLNRTCGGPDWFVRNGFTDTNQFLNAMVDCLKNAKITVNFSPHTYLDRQESELEEIETMYHRLSQSKEPRSMEYQRTREETEMRLFDFSSPLTKGTQDQGKTYGKHGLSGDPEFSYRSRPVYGALDYLLMPHGAAPQYGRSFVVLKPYMNAVATYSPVDTILGNISIAQLSTHTHLANLIYWLWQYDASRFHVDNLIKMVLHNRKQQAYKPPPRGWVEAEPPKRSPGYETGDPRSTQTYIEVHIHARVVFARDVSDIFLSQGQIDSWLATKPVGERETCKRELEDYMGILRNESGSFGNKINIYMIA